ncbi:hypothetical protein ACFV23_16700 [Streptomyces sp. NPDC059627]
MDADDPARTPEWSTTSPKELDRLARGVLEAARDAARELRGEPPDPERRTWALGMLAGRTQAMLGPDLPDHPPAGAEAQEGFVRTALALAVHVRAHSWADADLGAAGVPGRGDVPHPGDDGAPHPGEVRAADAFDVLGRLMLPHSSPAGWTATLVTDLARGDATLEAAVKLGKYVLHPTFLALVDDTTCLMGEALHNINVKHLRELNRMLRHHACAEPPDPAAERLPSPTTDPTSPFFEHPSVMEVEPTPDPAPRIRRTPRSPSNPGCPRAAPTDPPAPASPQRPHQPDSPRSRRPSGPGSPGVPGPHGFSCSVEPDPDPVSPDEPEIEPEIVLEDWLAEQFGWLESSDEPVGDSERGLTDITDEREPVVLDKLSPLDGEERRSWNVMSADELSRPDDPDIDPPGFDDPPSRGFGSFGP